MGAISNEGWVPTLIFPVGVTLVMRHPAQLPAHHAAILYALLAEAHGTARGEASGVPDGVLLDAPEQARLWLAQGDHYNFGFQVLAPDAAAADATIARIADGLIHIGQHGPRGSRPFSGNFELQDLHPLVGTDDANLPLSIPLHRIRDEQEAARRHRELTLRFVSPLRWERPKPERVSGGTFLDGEFFPAPLFARRTAQRAAALGYGQEIPALTEADVALVANELVWVDLSYGAAEARKLIGGAMGRVVLRVRNPAVADALVLGQYLRVGGNTRFGFGAYRIEELDPVPYRACRSIGLLDLALAHRELDRMAAKLDVPSGTVRRLADDIRSGTYEPRPAARFLLGGDRPRVLAVPAPADRVLQRAVLETIAPALDLFFEESSTAYRRNLGMQKAALRIRDAYRQGYRWALRSDFHRFFDSIDHAALRRRLDAYLVDDRLVDLIMLWVSSAAIQPGRGLPTGSVLSPLLANLFLDHFDEQVERDGARLVRYADDFLILFRDEEQGRALFNHARELAEQLRLRLNEQKTRIVDLTHPFEFLGFRFHREEQWVMSPSGELAHIDDIGWKQATPARDPQGDMGLLPGEIAGMSVDSDWDVHGCVVVGPGLAWMGVEHDHLVFRFDDDRPEGRVPTGRVRDVIAIGPPTIDRSTLMGPHASELNLILADRSGRLLRACPGEVPLDHGDLLVAQVTAAADPARRLAIGQALIRAKLLNHAALATAYPPRDASGDSVAHALIDLAGRVATATSVEKLLGFEGAGAAAWYGSLGRRLDSRFRFDRRVAPNAEDPVNVLLNLGQTVLHRLVGLAILREGLAPTLGLLHEARSGHDALASDLQEPFRHLVDRAVIEATTQLMPGQFKPDPHGPFALRIDAAAYRDFLALLFRGLARPCRAPGQGEPRSYRQQILVLARALRRHLLEPKVPLGVFTHP